ncbi:hypothetical protein LCM09_10085 [Alkalihalobacillus algicola]|nr:kinase [Alkalihalobacillus algicola]MCA0987641.1 hypothetical protein [Alkalihalobacillus algicola]
MRIVDLSTILSKVQKEKRIVIGIDGLSRSGKTTLVKKMRQGAPCSDREIVVIHLDDYIEVRKARYNTGHEEWVEYYRYQWDVPYLRDQLFKKVKVASELKLKRYDEQSDSHFLEECPLPDAAIILIEGVFLQRIEWRDYFDYMIYLECPRGTRFLRESEETQKKLAKFNERYWKAEDYYLEQVAPKENADLVLNSPYNGTSPS